MSSEACIALFPLSVPEGASGAHAHCADDRIIKNVRLEGVSDDWLLVAATEPGPVGAIAGAWRAEPSIRGIDRSAFAPSHVRSPPCFVDVVLDRADPPIPFDDPATLQIFRDFQLWYWPMFGTREARCEALWYDGVRTAGSILAFRAGSPEEAEYLASLNPWRRVAPGKLFRCPPGIFDVGVPPAGPGTQRSATFVCGERSSIAEPGTASREST